MRLRAVSKTTRNTAAAETYEYGSPDAGADVCQDDGD